MFRMSVYKYSYWK